MFQVVKSVRAVSADSHVHDTDTAWKTHNHSIALLTIPDRWHTEHEISHSLSLGDGQILTMDGNDGRQACEGDLSSVLRSPVTVTSLGMMVQDSETKKYSLRSGVRAEESTKRLFCLRIGDLSLGLWRATGLQKGDHPRRTRGGVGIKPSECGNFLIEQTLDPSGKPWTQFARKPCAQMPRFNRARFLFPANHQCLPFPLSTTRTCPYVVTQPPPAPAPSYFVLLQISPFSNTYLYK